MNPVTAAMLTFWLVVTSMAFLTFIGVFGTNCSVSSAAVTCSSGATVGEIFGLAGVCAAIAGLAEWPGLRKR
jgi:hypothetical protein